MRNFKRVICFAVMCGAGVSAAGAAEQDSQSIDAQVCNIASTNDGRNAFIQNVMDDIKNQNGTIFVAKNGINARDFTDGDSQAEYETKIMMAKADIAMDDSLMSMVNACPPVKNN